MSKIFIEESTLTAIGDAIRGKEGTTELVPVTDMATRITAIQSGGGGDLPEEAFHLTGDCSYRFYGGGWDWFIEKYGNQITTSELNDVANMFQWSSVSSIPFSLNSITSYLLTLDKMFAYSGITEVPEMNNFRTNNTNQMFYNCSKLRTVPENFGDKFDWSYFDTVTTGSGGNRSKMFGNCYSLRSVHSSFMQACNQNSTYNSYTIYYGAFQNCHALDEVIDINVGPRNTNITSNMFSNTVDQCYRLKNFTFALNPETNAPYVVNWKSQTLDLTTVGWCSMDSQYHNITDYNSGITADKKVSDAASYQALKNDPDWFAGSLAYSRYNHDSAVATINSLPDASDYLKTAGGSNTIKFMKNAGSATDGGAVGNLTDDEKAVAADKGWTVSM